ncbi:MAG: UDP-N-acetylglucosamine 1-carboxyvinyltransferase [Candidatus Nitrosocaldaceae archaeon]|nr:MAG: UDP-N-acetylglucosamine 1-carboxyvinyltransferase [Candidatus Nitrosocaldaceae archaeon]
MSIIIKGGKKLNGTVITSGSKNSTLPILAASLLSNSIIKLSNIPNIKDVTTMLYILKELGAYVTLNRNTITIDPSKLKSYKTSDLGSLIRSSILLIAPLVIKFKKAVIRKPGGCNIGERPIDLHLYGFEQLNAKIETIGEFIVIKCDKLIGNNIDLRYPSVGATENLMIAACCAEGKTTINNAAKEPEIEDLADFLIKMGAKIRGAGSSTIEINGVEDLLGTHHTIIPDRIEASTFMIAGAITNGNVRIKRAGIKHLTNVINTLEKIGIIIEELDDLILIGDVSKKGVDVVASPYPGFPTDVQPILAALLSTITCQKSSIIDLVYPTRFSYINELRKMGANIIKNTNKIIIEGQKELTGYEVTANDLRTGASLIVAGLAANGTTIITNYQQVERGYEDIYNKLNRLGANIKLLYNC